MKEIAKRCRKEKDDYNEKDVDQNIDHKRGRGDGSLFDAFGIRAYELNMSVFEQAAFCRFEDGDGGQEDREYTVT